ncbi:MAG: bacterioferritin [Alphaproteobacteria bacterium]|nr:bacterioferritin [Alphaproteobacteria bacterium]
MRGDSDIIQKLNGILTNELTAINQYFLHARLLQHDGLNRLGQKVYQESLGEMKHADMLVQRILLLEGHPNLQHLHKMKVGENVPEMFEADLAVETKNRADVQAAMTACEAKHDYETKNILGAILTDTEGHIDWLETQLGLIQKLGLPNYLQSQVDTAA